MRREQRGLRWEPERPGVESGGRVACSLKGNKRQWGQEQKQKGWLGTEWGQLIDPLLDKGSKEKHETHKWAREPGREEVHLSQNIG